MVTKVKISYWKNCESRKQKNVHWNFWSHKVQTKSLTLDFRFPFSSLLTLLLSLLYKTPVATRFPAKITSSCIWVARPVDWVILHWYARGTDGRSLGRALYGHVITKFSRMGSRILSDSRMLEMSRPVRFQVCDHCFQISQLMLIL